MKNLYTKVSFNIAAIFITIIFASFIPETFPEFFGDWVCNGTVGTPCRHMDVPKHEPAVHWGGRHWLWFLMSLMLFVVQAVRIIALIDDHNKTKNP